MDSDGLKRRLEALWEERARIDAEIEQLESQLEARERAEKRGAEVLEVEPARGGGSYVLQKVKCGKPTCRCARPGGQLHGPYWYYYYRKDGKNRSKYVGKNRPEGV
ncbi:MAG: hypothetical protein HPY61_14715 [Methanotrichaceae archaeon]|nr:hypothetical protein [Methanotrichaceae archaeon]